MASTAQDRASSQPQPEKGGGASDEKCFWAAAEKLQPNISIAGYWDTLQKNCEQWAIDVSVSPFWQAVKDRQPGWSNEFHRKTSGALLSSSVIPSFVGKRIKRIKEKVVHDWIDDGKPADVSKYWPPTGPPVPLLNDLVRTRIECQFLDGVEFFGNCLEQLATELDKQKCTRERQGRVVGYFAQHFCFSEKVIFRFGGSEDLVAITCEVQIATALATRVWEESHRIYEVWRAQSDRPEDWQWNPADPRFTSRQLGHMVHLADGLLVQLRNTAQTKP